jgi:hypothetical protein
MPAAPEPSPRFLYRAGSRTKRNLTPRVKDPTGPSAYSVYEKAAEMDKRVQTIDASRLKDLRAVQEGDDPHHYVIQPTDLARMPEWIESRDDDSTEQEDWHPLTQELLESIVADNLPIP